MTSTKEIRIKAIQAILKVPQTGIFDLTTCKAFEAFKKLNIISTDLAVHKKEIQKSLGFTGTDVDGDVGSMTLGRIENELKNSTPVAPATDFPNEKMKTLIIGAGHGGTDSGAVGSGFKERDLAIEFRNLLVAELKKLSVTCITDPDVNKLADSLVYFKNHFKPDSINVDIHWNAGPPAATGTEVLINTQATPFEKQLGGKIAEAIATILNIKNRGLKTELQSARGSLAWMKQLGRNYIIEMCFISNKTDMDKYQAKKHELAKAIAQILFDAVRQ
jgi:N-acetylmuramoyl-L-alanine amidase